MSKDYPLINDDAEALRDGNKAYEAIYHAETLNKDYIKIGSLPYGILALDGSVSRFSSSSTHEESWDLSSIEELKSSDQRTVLESWPSGIETLHSEQVVCNVRYLFAYSKTFL